jgi:hypothetical protein
MERLMKMKFKLVPNVNSLKLSEVVKNVRTFSTKHHFNSTRWSNLRCYSLHIDHLGIFQIQRFTFPEQNKSTQTSQTVRLIESWL